MSFAAPTLALMVFPLSLLFAAASDVQRYIIPNSASLALIAGFILVYPFALIAGGSEELGFGILGEHLASGAACFAIGFLLFATGQWGGGDGKLLAAAGLWFDWPTVLEFALATAIAGGALAFVVLLTNIICAKLRFYPGLAKHLDRIDWVKRSVDAPYGVAIAAGALYAFPSTELFHALAVAPLL